MQTCGWLTRTLPMLGVLTCFAAGVVSAQERQAVRIRVVLDGPSERNEEIRTVFEREIKILLGEEFDVQFPAEKRLQADPSSQCASGGQPSVSIRTCIEAGIRSRRNSGVEEQSATILRYPDQRVSA